ncbi:MAG: hypothetical protein Q4B70_04450 [Lachnospiraceae bacterium]|nr:hypothetical protein [Lachnospiraceae bacterium]
MTDKEKNNLFYVCALVEYTARKTKNKRGVIVESLGEEGIRRQLCTADVNHCLSFEQVSDELIEDYQIPQGNFDTIINCRYKIPGFQDIGRLYSYMVLDCARPGEEIKEMIKIFTSFISDEISNFKTGVYYENLSYLECSYKEGYLLD